MPRRTRAAAQGRAQVSSTLVAVAPAAGEVVRRGRGRLRDEDAQVLEAQLTAAAREAFTTHGYGATSMSALARAAGVSRTTLYARFPTKFAIFKALVDEQMVDAYGWLHEADTEAPTSLAGALRRLAEHTLTAAMRHQDLALNRLIEWEAPRFPELQELAQVKARVAIEHIAAYIREFAVRDETPCRRPEAAAEAFNFMVRGLYHDIGVGRLKLTPDLLRERVDTIVAIFLASRPIW